MKRIAFTFTALAIAAMLGCGGDDGGGKRPPRASSKGGKSSSSKKASETAKAAEPTGWATLTGTFVYGGEPPTLSPISVTGDNATQCGAFGLREETLLVNEANKGIKNIFVYLRTKTPHHESFAGQADAVVGLSNRQCRFEPHVVALWLSQPLSVSNDDPFSHNTNITAPGDKDANKNPMLLAGDSIQTQFTRNQNVPFPVSCSIHPWMRSYVLPRENPYFAVTDENGKFTIENVPAGIELEFQVWQEEAGFLPAKADWDSGRFKVTLQPDETMDLGEVNIVPSLFKR